MSARSFLTSTFMRVSYCFGMRRVPATTPPTTRKNVTRISHLRRARMAARSFREIVLAASVGVIEAHFWPRMHMDEETRGSFESESTLHGCGYAMGNAMGFEGMDPIIEFRQLLGEIVLRARRSGQNVLQGLAGEIGDVAGAVGVIACLEQFELLLGETERDHLFSAVGIKHGGNPMGQAGQAGQLRTPW